MKTTLLIAVIGTAALVILFACGVLIWQRICRPAAFEYRLCLAQESRVTFVNGVWQGRRQMDPDDSNASLDSCPAKWEYLATAGKDGWELVCAVTLTHAPDQQLQELYLRREKR